METITNTNANTNATAEVKVIKALNLDKIIIPDDENSTFDFTALRSDIYELIAKKSKAVSDLEISDISDKIKAKLAIYNGNAKLAITAIYAQELAINPINFSGYACNHFSYYPMVITKEGNFENSKVAKTLEFSRILSAMQLLRLEYSAPHGFKCFKYASNLAYEFAKIISKETTCELLQSACKTASVVDFGNNNADFRKGFNIVLNTIAPSNFNPLYAKASEMNIVKFNIVSGLKNGSLIIGNADNMLDCLLDIWASVYQNKPITISSLEGLTIKAAASKANVIGFKK